MTDLVVDHVNFAYRETPVLTDISLKLQPNSFNLLVGPSGSGKSTLLKLLSGLYPTFSDGTLTGKLTLDGYDIHDIVPYQRVAHIGYLFQNPTRQFVMKTPFEELRFSLENLQINPDEIEARILTALEKVGMTAFMHHDLLNLSGGEKQKVALAAVLAADSDYLLLDEPFANVDPVARLQLIDVVKAYQKKGKTIVITDHDWSGYTDAIDDIFVMTDGHLHNALVDERQQILEKVPSQPAIHADLPSEKKGIITLESVSLSSGDRTLLSSATLPFPKGKRILITGPNGVGKSTLLSALVKLHPYSGDITYQQQNIAKRKIAKHVKDVALVFQNAEQQFVAMTVEEELTQAQTLSQSPDLWSDDTINQVLSQLNMDALRDHIVYQLSGGQQKKLQVLLMLIIGTPTLLFDEPLAGLDNISQQNMLNVIAEFATRQHQTIIMISHQLHAVTDWFDYHLQFENQQLSYIGGVS
ncbi:ABC transporter ATP-binding protein [Leuconostoc rapi]|uniref:ABC transporter ATP-binding protein n=1 Tax=Leuconostoc rapi TaxID=1406906 RepID=UPI00195BE4B5|nr:ABC transporter ATP-binding protein [Leuconostoc rapi]MBM7435361.1 energy-coupling factor transport system ATP-binding protein [Leuconostoc rapi]